MYRTAAHRNDMAWGTALLGKTPKAIKPLSEAKYVSACIQYTRPDHQVTCLQSNAHFMAESFLFSVVASRQKHGGAHMIKLEAARRCPRTS
jgi:hypothetical protein